MKYQELKQKQSDDLNKLFEELGVFWAFGNEQFKAGLDKLIETNKLKPGEKIVDIGAGGFMPKNNLDAFIKGNKEITEAYKKAVKEFKEQERVEAILYELNNHEAFYTGDIETTRQALGSSYTKEEILSVYKLNQNQYA
jgi:hypothetical protein